MHTTAVRTTSLLAAGAAVLLGACGGGDDPVASAADAGASTDPGDFHASLQTLAADVDSAPVGEVSPDVLTAAQETSAAAAEAVPALEDGEGVEEVDATTGGLESLTDACAALGL